MADRAISDLTAATQVTSSDLFVLEQNNTAKKLTGQILMNDLATALDGHGGINDITYTTPSSGSLSGTLTITLADGTVETLTVTNGRGITSIAKTGTSGLTDTYTISYNNNTTSSFTINNGRGITGITEAIDGLEHTYTIAYNDGTTTDIVLNDGNGVSSVVWFYATSESNSEVPTVWYDSPQTMTPTFKYLWGYQRFTQDDGTTLDTTPSVIGAYGDTGQNWYVHIKYSSDEPTSDNDMGDDPDAWIGMYSGTSENAPVHYTDYDWYQWKGDRGLTGNGIASVNKTGTSGVVDTYTVTFTDGNTATFTVTNGSNIASITKTSTSGLDDTYTVTLTNGQTTQFTVSNAKSITSITWTNTTSPSGIPHVSGATDTYTITYNNGDTSQFQVYNGLDGEGASLSVDDIPANNGNVPLLTIGTGAPSGTTQGSIKSRYFDSLNSVLYICVGYDSQTGIYDWRGAGVTVDAALSTSSTNPVQNAIITNKVGTATLTTTAQNLSGAVNEHDAELGDVGTALSSMTATDVAGAITELSGEIADVDTALDGKVSKTGDTMTGQLSVSRSGSISRAFTAISEDLTDGTAVSATTDGSSVYFADANSSAIGIIHPRFRADGKQGLAFRSRRQLSGSNSDAFLEIGKDASGNEYVSISSPTAWRTTLGAVNKAGDTMTGGLTLNGTTGTTRIRLKTTDLTDGTVVGTLAWSNRLVIYDSADKTLGILHGTFRTDGRQGITLRSRRQINGSDSDAYIEVGKNSSGSEYVEVSSASAWRNALGLGTSGALPITIAQGGSGQTGTATIITSISDIISAESGFTITAANYTYWGKVAMLYVQGTLSASIGASSTAIATIKTGKRPMMTADCSVGGFDTAASYSFIGTDGKITTRNVPAGSIRIKATYILA